MVNAKEFFESNFIKAENIKGGEIARSTEKLKLPRSRRKIRL